MCSEFDLAPAHRIPYREPTVQPPRLPHVARDGESMSDFEGADRRMDPRAPIELKVEYKKLNTFFADYTKNISKGGTFIRTPRPLDVGTVFVFRLTVPK